MIVGVKQVQWYSDDHGKTWHRGESPNESEVSMAKLFNEKDFSNPAYELTESQVVECRMTIKLFMRNYSGYAMLQQAWMAVKLGFRC